MIDYIIFLIVFSLVIFYLGLYKKDQPTIMFSSFLMILSGLHIVNFGFGNLPILYSFWTGMLFILFSIYIALRCSIDLIWLNDRKTREVKHGIQKARA